MVHSGEVWHGGTFGEDQHGRFLASYTKVVHFGEVHPGGRAWQIRTEKGWEDGAGDGGAGATTLKAGLAEPGETIAMLAIYHRTTAYHTSFICLR